MIYLKDGNIPLNLAYDDDIVQEANSTYQLSFKFPLTDGKWNLLKREVFLLADDLHGEQEFFIFEAKKAKGYVQVYAKQVATLLNYYSINSISVDRVPGQTVMTALAGSVKRPCPFTFFSDIMDRHTFNESDVSVMDALIKDKHSIIGQWGGDLVRDKYQVKLLKNGGIENESLFMYKKNLSSYEETESIHNLKTRLHLKKVIKGQTENDEDRVIVVTVDSPLIGQYSQIYEADIEVNDQDVTDEASLTAYSQQYFSSTLCDLVENSITLDVKGKADVSVKMFDTVSVFHERFNVDLRLKITSYRFAPMAKRLKSIGFGKVLQSFGSTVASMVAGSVDKATGTLSASFERRLQTEIDNANRHFDVELDKFQTKINDGIEQAQANAEVYADNIKQTIADQMSESDRQYQSDKQAQDQQIAESLRLAGASTNLANTAKTLAEQAKADLNLAKQSLGGQIAQVSTQASQFFDASREETARQVSALRVAVTQDYVAKSVFEENARGISQRFESLYVGGTNLLTGTDEYAEFFNSEQSHAEFLRTPYDLAEVFDKHGLVEYTLSFDLKAPKTGAVHVYQQNGSDSRYAGLGHDVLATTEWQRFKITFRPVLGNPAIKESYLAFYGIYGTGVKPIVRRVKIERGTIGTDWSPAPEDATNYADTKIAEYKHTVDGRFATIQASVDSKANLVDFQRVQETARLYERIIGTSESEVNSNLARQVLTSSLWQTEITRLPRAGGKNYFLNSNFKEGMKFWHSNSGNPGVSFNVNGQLAGQLQRSGVLHVNTGDVGFSYAHGFYQYVEMPLSANDQVTVSLDVAAFPNNDAGLVVILVNHLFDIRKEIPVTEIPKTSVFSPTSLKRKTATLSIPKDCAGIYCNVIFGQGTIGNMVFADMQVEKGGATSDYQPNPADTKREVEAVTTRVDHLAGSWAVQNLTSAGTVLNQINLLANGNNRIDGRLTHITGQTLIDDASITSAKIASLDAGKITSGYIRSERIATNSIDGSKIVFDQAFFNKLMANEAYLKQLFAQTAFITQVQSVTMSAAQIIGGTMMARNGAMEIGLDNAFFRFRDNAKIEFQSENNTLFRTKNGTSAFIHFRDDTYNGVYTAMGVNADNTGTQNDYSSGQFAGVRVIRTNPNRYSGATVDQVQLIGDTINIRHGYGYENDYLRIAWDGGSRIDLIAWLRQMNINFKHLVNITGRGDVIKTF